MQVHSKKSSNNLQHRWNLSYREAVAVQEKLRGEVSIQPLDESKINYLAAADISFSLRSPVLYAAVLLFTYPDLRLIKIEATKTETTFPYIPGLLSFREAPVLLPLFQRIDPAPDVILVDGQGIAHPRRFGLAAHLGVLLNLPAIGCAKTKLYGDYQSEPREKGDWVSLTDGDEEIGRVLCTRKNVKPIFVSVGNLVDMDSAIPIVLHSSPKFRIPEPIRQAHQEVNRLRVADQNGSEK